MGLIKAIIVLSISVVVSNIFLRFLKKNKSKPIIKQIEPYINNRSNIIIFIMMLLLILT